MKWNWSFIRIPPMEQISFRAGCLGVKAVPAREEMLPGCPPDSNLWFQAITWSPANQQTMQTIMKGCLRKKDAIWGDYWMWMLSLLALGKEWIGIALSSNQIFLKHSQGLFCNFVNILKASLDLTRACAQLWFHYALKQMSFSLSLLPSLPSTSSFHLNKVHYGQLILKLTSTWNPSGDRAL